MQKPVVVVPVYRESLSRYEWISLTRIFKILGSHQICLLSPRSRVRIIDEKVKKKIRHADYIFHLVDDLWLDSISSYNHLMLTKKFYQFYRGYTHILVSQLDSYVFKDELEKWCAEPWSYIGAPIYPPGAAYGKTGCQSLGCGGFSLRRTSRFLDAFEVNPKVFTHEAARDVLLPYSVVGCLSKARSLAQLIWSGDTRIEQKSNSIQRMAGINEDVLFGKYLPKVFPGFLIPDYWTACRFSLDRYMEKDLPRLPDLPFGVHAWHSSSSALKVWSEFIPELRKGG